MPEIICNQQVHPTFPMG